MINSKREISQEIQCTLEAGFGSGKQSRNVFSYQTPRVSKQGHQFVANKAP